MTLNYDLELLKQRCDELRDAADNLANRPGVPFVIGLDLMALRPAVAKLSNAIAKFQKGKRK